MRRHFFDPTPEQQNVVLVDAADLLREPEKRIESCEHCHPADADTPFDWILDRVTGSDPSVTDLHYGRTGEISELPARDSGKNAGCTG